MKLLILKSSREIFLLSKLYRLDMGPTHRLILWILGGSSLGVKQLGLEIDHSPPSSAEVKNECSYTPSSLICFYFMQFPPVACYLIPHRYKYLPVENPQPVPFL